MKNDSKFLSRERAAGYDPHRLAAMRVLLVGVGALGQNVSLNLALSQIGHLCLVDFDDFESHNATRSPCYPSPSERRRWGISKATVVAHKLRKLVSWSRSPQISFFHGPVQQFSDALFANATIAISAVDNNTARAYIATMCRKHRLPLVEGGFDGPDISFCVLMNDSDGPCWSCHQSIKIVDQLTLSCTTRAQQAEQKGFVPAIQSAAANLGSLMAEATIQLAHGNQEGINRRVYLNIRSARATVVRLTKDAHCQSRHNWPKPSFEIALENETRAGQLLDQLSRRLPNPTIFLPHRFIAVAPCFQCNQSVKINQPDWAIHARPVCTHCGGPWKRCDRATDGMAPLEVYAFVSKDDPLLVDLPLEVLGIVPGSLLEIRAEDGTVAMIRISGSLSPTPV